jgi:hypothetical protein
LSGGSLALAQDPPAIVFGAASAPPKLPAATAAPALVTEKNLRRSISVSLLI